MLKKLKLSTKRFSGDSFTRKLKMCKKCLTFYYKNSWHFDKPAFLDFSSEEEIPVRFTECPACLEQEISSYDLESGIFA